MMRPPAQWDGRTLKIAALMALLLGFLLYMTALDGDSWKSNTDSLLLIAVLAVGVVTKDKRQRRVPLDVKAGPFRKADPQVVQEIMKQLRKKSPGIYCGYDDAIIRLYRSNFAGMVAHVEAKYAEIHSSRL